MFYYERKFKKKGFDFIIGVDEAGRGPLAGPVVAGAIILNCKRFNNRIFDSKKLTALQREKAFFELLHKSTFSIGVMNERVIEELNILEASRLAMENAIYGLIHKIDQTGEMTSDYKKRICVLVDGNVKLDIGYPYVNIIRGDSRSKTIAAASIVAKFTRDRIMGIYSKVYPQYGFFRHKGYPTRSHKMALRKYGPVLIHRRTFLRCLGQA
jgi:ribonuclease HII